MGMSFLDCNTRLNTYTIFYISFSHKVIWLEVSPTNKNSAGYYVDAVKRLGMYYAHELKSFMDEFYRVTKISSM